MMKSENSRINFVEGFAVQGLTSLRASPFKDSNPELDSGQRFKSFGFFEFLNFGVLKVQLFSYSVILLFSCGRSYNTQQPVQDKTEIERQKKEILMRVNQELVEEDAETIKTYAERMGWKLNPTESGLWYMIYRNGQGEKATTGKTATLEYTLLLLDSTVCYSSEQLGQKIFRLGRGEVEAGLEEGVLQMRMGDKARLFLPPHLAHGLTGDGDCIPRRTIIIYDVELVKITSR